jgi:hypothetical protein
MSAATPDKIQPKPQKDTIYLEPDDEITSIIEKVEAADNKVIALVLPKRTTSLQSIVNMRLLKRSADKAGKSVVLITSDPALLPLAGATMLHVAKNLQSKPEIPIAPDGTAKEGVEAAEMPEDVNDAENEDVNTKLDYHRSVGELAAVHALADDGDAIDLEDEDAEAKSETSDKKPKEKKSKGLKVPNFDRFRAMLGIGGILLIGLAAFLIMAIWVLPKGVITIQTESIPVTANLTLNASETAKALDIEKKIIPISTKTTKQTSSPQVPATGQQNNGVKATGTVSMTAQACAPNLGIPDSVPAGTGVSTSGLTYITQSKTTFAFSSASGSCVNYAATGSTSITAQAGGTKYNVSGATFSVSGRSDVNASGSASGGTDNITTVVSQSDVDNAKQKVTSADTDKFVKDYEKQLSDQGFYVLTATLKQSDPVATANPAVGQPANTTTVTVEITYTVQVVQKSDLTKAITAELNKQINPSKQKLTSTDVLKDATISVQNAASPSDIKIDVSVESTAIPLIDPATIQKLAAGKKSGDIKAAISGLPGVKSVDVKLSPFWVSKAPRKYTKTTVIIKPINKSASGSNASNAP